MNKRIRELADQTGFSLIRENCYDTVSTAQVQEFAELILKECFQYLENEEDRLWDLSEKEEDQIFQSNFEICAEKCRDVREGLKEHFGVEE